MKRLLALASVAQVLLVWGCTAVSTAFDYDTETDFSGLHTYTWVAVEHDETTSELILARIENAVRDILATRGFLAVSEGPDFSIHAHVSRRERTEITKAEDRYSARGSAGYHLEIHSYDEGTLVLDVESPETGALIWRGVARRAVNTQWTPEQITERVREAVELLLAEFPPGE